MADIVTGRKTWWQRAGGVRVEETKFGTYEIVMRLDGFYANREDADSMVRFWSEQLVTQVNK